MRKIENFFTRIKAWQLFLLLFVLPTSLGFVAMTLVMGQVTEQTDPELAQRLFLTLWGLFNGLSFVFMVLFLGWLWSCGTALNRGIAPSLRTKTVLFRIAVIFPLFYIPFFMITASPVPAHRDAIEPFTALVTPLHLFSMFCIFYLFYFVSKSLSNHLNKPDIESGSSVGYFFAIWFYPIGIWFIQPKINRMVQNEMHNQPPQTRATSGPV